jgi:RNA polymerase-associated protein
MAIQAKKNIMSLFADEYGIPSHQVRMVLAEKGVNVEIIPVDLAYGLPEDLLDLNPYGTVPTLLDRELVLYESRIIMEYLDERFPHPPLLPVYPVARAESRKMMYRIEHDWYSLVNIIEDSAEREEVEQARQQLRESLTNVAPVFGSKPFFLSDEFSLLDCYIAPLLWRLSSLEIELPKTAKAITEYAKTIFDRKSFQASLTDCERELQEAA